MRALWIEISTNTLPHRTRGSRPVRALWIEILRHPKKLKLKLSRPVRALWIEISNSMVKQFWKRVEAREGLVD